MENGLRVSLGYRRADTAPERISQDFNAWEAPRLPGTSEGTPRRWHGGPTWTAPDAVLLVRHRAADGSRRVVTNDRTPPEGYVIEYDLGMARRYAQPGTQRLIASDETFLCTPFEGVLAGGYRGLGYVEQAPLPLLDALELRIEPETGQELLVCGPNDPLYGSTLPRSSLGFIESYPLNPRTVVDTPVARHMTTLVREADATGWRHRYLTTQSRPQGQVALGGIWQTPGPGLIALRRTPDGWLESDACQFSRAPAGLTARLRWALSPMKWYGARPRSWALRATGRRLHTLSRGATAASRPDATHTSSVIGYLRQSKGQGSSPLFSTLHPALSDQYVTRSEIEATDMGYRVAGILGYISDSFADRTLDVMPEVVKWASRFGLGRRYIEGPADFNPRH